MVQYSLNGGSPGHQDLPRRTSDEEDSLIGTFVWLKVDDADEWAPARIEQRWAGKVHLLRTYAPKGTPLKVELSEAEFAKLPRALDSIAQGGAELPADLVELHDLSECTMLHTLRERYQRDAIYTAIGPVLVSINPYKPVATCALDALHRLAALAPDDRPPHVFTIAARAYANLIDYAEPQSIMISGESGAGKTETTKLCLTSLMLVSGSSGLTVDKALNSGELLESFGNAKTVYNNNSSRFGKWGLIHFSASGKVDGCTLETYLLEQSRIVAPSARERNYHIFYHLLAGASEEERSQLKLANSHEDYKYTAGEATSPGIDDKSMWGKVKAQLELLGFSSVQQRTVFTLLSTVLALGNVDFGGEGEDTRCTTDAAKLQLAASLLQVDQAELGKAMTTRQLRIGENETATAMMRAEQCANTRDAISRALYSSLFDHVVSRINVSLREGEPEEGRYIGVLDIFGFENFAMNSFEQLCINFTNERLQQLFMDCLVKREQAEYTREGIQCSQITYPDNSHHVALIDDKKNGIFAYLDDECNAPKGSDENFVTRMHAALDQKNKLYSRPKFGVAAVGADLGKAMDKLQFVVTHYAEKVQYTAFRWLEKNRGTLSPELTALLASAGNPIVQMAFPEASVVKKTPTVSYTFRQSLRALASTVIQTYQHFIRCMKPNLTKQPDAFNGKFVASQMRYQGVHAVVEINRVGYPAKFVMKEFIRRYRCIAFDQPALLSEKLGESAICNNLIKVAAGSKVNEWFSSLNIQAGLTKVFMRNELLQQLERPRRAARGKAALSVQKFARRRLARRVAAMVRLHVARLRGVHAALRRLSDDRSAAAVEKVLLESREKLEALAEIWEASTLPPTLHASLAWRARQLREQQAEQKSLDERLSAEVEATAGLLAVLAKETSTSKEAFLLLKAATHHARSMDAGLTSNLHDAVKRTEAAIDSRFSSMLEEWEEEVKRAEAAREVERMARCKEQETKYVTSWDGSVELVTVQLRNGVDPKSVTLKQLTGFSDSLGVVLNEMNVVEYLKGGGTAMLDAQLAAGDVLLAVDGAALNGRRAAEVIAERNLPTVSVVVARPIDTRPERKAELPSGDFTGWLHVVRAKVTFKGMVPLHASRKVWVVVQGSTFQLHEEQSRPDAKGERPLNLCNAVCKPYQKPKGGGRHHIPVVAEMYARNLFPFKVSWCAAEYDFELVFGAPTREDRTAWVKAMEDAIESAPFKGWLTKRQPPRTGLGAKLFKTGWDRQWFDLQFPQGELDASLSIYDDPASMSPIGIVPLNKDSELTLCSKFAAKGMPHVLLLTTPVNQDAKPVETFLACDSKAEMEKWKNALTRALRSFHKQRGAAPTLTKEEKELHTKSIQQLRVMLEYLGVDFDKKTEDKYKLSFLIVKHRDLNKIAKKEGVEDKNALMNKIRKEEARLLQRSVEELNQLLEYMEVEQDAKLTDKERLIKVIINQKNLPAVTKSLAPELLRWCQRSKSSSGLQASGRHTPRGGNAPPVAGTPTVLEIE
ncbi:hypothetical protein AB1Y20_003107 [Prymnesium parvum]|uniref:Uncharacterized protein n=1 Tax=Prymnesium parvum TaxID=97485 RepID=A0AB34JD55_PRYPA